MCHFELKYSVIVFLLILNSNTVTFTQTPPEPPQCYNVHTCSGPIASWMTNILGWRLTTVIGEYFAQAMPILRFMGGSDVNEQ